MDHLFFNIMRKKISVYFSKLRLKSQSEIENMITSQKLILLKVGILSVLRMFFKLMLLSLYKSKSKLLMSTVGIVVRCSTDNLTAWVRSLWQVFSFSRRIWLNLSEALSNNVVQPTTVVQKCAIPVVNTRSRPP